MGIPTHRVEIRKTWQGHDWSNDYLVESPSMDAAAAFALTAVEFERSFHNNMVTFVYVRTSTVAKFDRIFRHVPLNLQGVGSTDTVDLMPLFNTVRMDLQTADSDPCRKYFRIPISESDQSNGVIIGAKVIALGTLLNNFIATFNETTKVVSGKGHNVIAGRVYPQVQMRQLHRHKKKKVVV